MDPSHGSALRIGASEVSVPAIAEVAQIAAIEDAVLRNLRITQCYHELSNALVARLGPELNWCTLACAIARRRLQVIDTRGLEAEFQRILTECMPERAVALERLAALWARRSWSRRETAAIRAALDQELETRAGLAHASEAVARIEGTSFSEVGLHFARFLATFRSATTFVQADIDRFCGFFEAGRPPRGQDELARAFRAYHQALFEEDPKIRSQLVLLGNLAVTEHEQHRFQPHFSALLEPHWESDETEFRVIYERLRPNPAAFEGWIRKRLERSQPIRKRWRELVNAHRNAALEAVGEPLATLDVAGHAVDLRFDLDRGVPQPLVRLTHGELALRIDDLESVGRTHTECRWGQVSDRLRAIAHFLRAYQTEDTLHEPPFSAQEEIGIRAGRLPAWLSHRPVEAAQGEAELCEVSEDPSDTPPASASARPESTSTAPATAPAGGAPEAAH